MRRLLVGLLAGTFALIMPAVSHADTNTAHTYHMAQHLLHHDHLTRAGRRLWDGRYSYNERTEMCVELFNGTSHDIKPFKRFDNGMPPGFYIKLCSDGNFYINDGLPFKHMHSY